ncbi:MAG: hypothetical protein FWE33_00780 [Defluviitaleaceae bacterium]|nr:hypothetical protein [Defluviitaleaceae bacterium]
MKFLVGLLIFVFGVVFITLINGNLEIHSIAAFLDGPTIITFGFTLFAVTVITGNVNLFFSGIFAIFNKDKAFLTQNREKLIVLFELLRKTTIYTGVLVFTIGFVLMLGNLQDIERFAMNTALCALAFFWAMVINIIIFNPIIAILRKQ